MQHRFSNKVILSKLSQKVTNVFGLQICFQELSKIAQSGHTARQTKATLMSFYSILATFSSFCAPIQSNIDLLCPPSLLYQGLSVIIVGSANFVLPDWELFKKKSESDLFWWFRKENLRIKNLSVPTYSTPMTYLWECRLEAKYLVSYVSSSCYLLIQILWRNFLSWFTMGARTVVHLLVLKLSMVGWYLNVLLWILILGFFKVGHFRPLLFFFSLFNTVDRKQVSKCSI